MAKLSRLILLTGLMIVCFCQVRGGMMTGGIKTRNPNDKDVKEAAEIALGKFNDMSNSMNMMMMGKILSASAQVVAGTLYTFKIEMGESACRKSDIINKKKQLEDCAPPNNYEVYEMQLWSQPWLNKYRLTKHVCMTCAARASIDTIKKRKRRNLNSNNIDAVMNMGSLRFQKSGHLLGGDDHDKKHDQLTKDYARFKDFKTRYNKQYKTEEEHEKRFGIFQQNMKKVEFIQKHEMGSARYGATPFADLTEKEFRQNYLSPTWDQSFDSRLKQAAIPTEKAPEAFDWRDHDAVTAVKNQGSCGSCWAFSTTGNVEGQWAIKKKKLVSLSEQELVDCDKLDQGCGGGLPSNAYEAIQSLGGLETEKEYPYKGEDEKCAFIKSEAKIYVNGSLNISSDETKMAAWLAKNGPISIGINAFAMQFYFGGIAHPWKIFCDPESLDHGVLIVGYGVKDNEPYWIIKNSWGTWWGEDGYYLVYRGSGVCGLNRMCTSAEVL